MKKTVILLVFLVSVSYSQPNPPILTPIYTSSSGGGGGAIALIDNSTFTSNAGANTHIWSYTTSAGVNYVTVYLATYKPAGNGYADSAHYNGVKMERINYSIVGTRGVTAFGLKVPASGTHDLQVWMYNGANDSTAAAVAAGWSNVNQTTPYGGWSARQEASTSPSRDTVVSTTGEVVIDGILAGISTTSLTQDAAQTLIGKAVPTATTANQLGCSYKPGETQTVMTWTLSPASNHIHCAIALKP